MNMKKANCGASVKPTQKKKYNKGGLVPPMKKTKPMYSHGGYVSKKK